MSRVLPVPENNELFKDSLFYNYLRNFFGKEMNWISSLPENSVIIFVSQVKRSNDVQTFFTILLFWKVKKEFCDVYQSYSSSELTKEDAGSSWGRRGDGSVRPFSRNAFY